MSFTCIFCSQNFTIKPELPQCRCRHRSSLRTCAWSRPFPAQRRSSCRPAHLEVREMVSFFFGPSVCMSNICMYVCNDIPLSAYRWLRTLRVVASTLFQNKIFLNRIKFFLTNSSIPKISSTVLPIV